jgi:hypothetical protein
MGQTAFFHQQNVFYPHSCQMVGDRAADGAAADDDDIRLLRKIAGHVAPCSCRPLSRDNFTAKRLALQKTTELHTFPQTGYPAIMIAGDFRNGSRQWT